jgi:hypothetical protein
MSKEIDWPPGMRRQAELSDLFDKQARVGKFLHPHKVQQIAIQVSHQQDAPEAEFLGKAYHRNIFFNGLDALAHVCLPLDCHLTLVANGIETISALQRAIENKSLTRIKGIGSKTEERIIQIYEKWKDLSDYLDTGV